MKKMGLSWSNLIMDKLYHALFFFVVCYEYESWAKIRGVRGMCNPKLLIKAHYRKFYEIKQIK